MEHIVYQQAYEYLQQNNLITSEQFGFRPKLSTKIALTQLTEETIQNIDNKMTIVLFLSTYKRRLIFLSTYERRFPSDT